MTRIYCQNVDCNYCDPADFICCAACVTVGEEHMGGCSEYESYSSNKEYREPFYVILSDKNGKPWAKAIRHGKRIEYNGRIFYTTDRVTEAELYSVTEKRTGVDCGRFFKLKERWEKFLELEKPFADVENYPLAVRKGYEWILAEEGEENK